MPISIKDKNRASLVQAIIKQSNGKVFTVVAKRKTPKISYVHYDALTRKLPNITQSEFGKLSANEQLAYSRVEENFMELTCRTGVTKDLKGGKSTIANKPDLISVHLTNGKGYRCFSAYNVLEIRTGGATMRFKEADVLSFKEDK